LICLGRALLKETKLLIMDEATASIDEETDAFIQQTVRSEFADRTVLTIAHRLPTIIDCDRVLVLGDGQVLEFDTCANLLQRPDSVFAKLVDDTGPLASEYLRTMAFQKQKS